LLQSHQIGQHIFNLLGCQQRLTLYVFSDLHQAGSRVISRHDGLGVQSPAVRQPQPQLAFRPAATCARQAGCQVALKALFRQRAAVAQQAQTHLAVSNNSAAFGGIAGCARQ